MVDWDRIAELKNDILCEDFPEVFAMFLEEVEEVLHRLRDAPNLGSYEEDFHFLKGSALNVGFTEFGAVCDAAEQASAKGNAESVDVEQVLKAYDVSLQTFMSRSKEYGIAA